MAHIKTTRRGETRPRVTAGKGHSPRPVHPNYWNERNWSWRTCKKKNKIG